MLKGLTGPGQLVTIGEIVKNSQVNWKDRMAALRIVAVYATIGGLWILCSDTVLGWLIHDPTLMTRIAIYKGLFFVLATAFLLYHLIARHVLRLTKANRRIAASEERFQAIYDNMLEAVLILDPASGQGCRCQPHYLRAVWLFPDGCACAHPSGNMLRRQFRFGIRAHGEAGAGRQRDSAAG